MSSPPHYGSLQPASHLLPNQSVHPGALRAQRVVIDHALPLLIGCKRILDAPSRSGRLSILLSKAGLSVTGVDKDERAVATAREYASAATTFPAFQLGNIENMSFADRHFDATVCVQFYPSLADDLLRERVIAELCRVSNRYVLLSFLSPFSCAAMWRAAKWLAGRHNGLQHSNSLRSLRTKLDQRGFRLIAAIPSSRFIDGFCLGIFQRR